MRLAVVMSIYINDSVNYVQEAINSIFTQTYKSFDLYIQIDGSVSDTVRSFINQIKETQNVYVSEESENKGLAKSLNNLLLKVLIKDYQYIARMDADDISCPERFMKQIDYLDKYLDIDIVGTWAIEIDERNVEFDKKRMPLTHSQCFKFFKKRDCLIHPTVMFRNTYFKKAGLYPEDTYFGEDTMMWANGFYNHCKFSNIPEYLFYFRINSNFFERRRGWMHAKAIFSLRCHVNKMLEYGFSSYIYAFLYAAVKMMPKPILKRLYKIVR